MKLLDTIFASMKCAVEFVNRATCEKGKEDLEKVVQNLYTISVCLKLLEHSELDESFPQIRKRLLELRTLSRTDSVRSTIDETLMQMDIVHNVSTAIKKQA